MPDMKCWWQSVKTVLVSLVQVLQHNRKIKQLQLLWSSKDGDIDSILVCLRLVNWLFWLYPCCKMQMKNSEFSRVARSGKPKENKIPLRTNKWHRFSSILLIKSNSHHDSMWCISLLQIPTAWVMGISTTASRLSAVNFILSVKHQRLEKTVVSAAYLCVSQ